MHFLKASDEKSVTHFTGCSVGKITKVRGCNARTVVDKAKMSLKDDIYIFFQFIQIYFYIF